MRPVATVLDGVDKDCKLMRAEKPGDLLSGLHIQGTLTLFKEVSE